MRTKLMVSAAAAVLLGVVGLGAALVPQTALAYECSYDDSDAVANCKKAVDDAANKQKNNQSGKYSDVPKRVEGVGDAVKECLSCAKEKIEQATGKKKEE